MAIRCASSGDRGRPLSRPLRGAEPTDLGSRGARDGAEREGARCRTFLVQIIPQRVGRTADRPKPPINPRTETGARHLNLTGAAAAQISLATAEKRRCDRGKTFCLARVRAHGVAFKSAHDARLMPAKYVRPYSKGQKNDFRDAEAIAEAVQR